MAVTMKIYTDHNGDVVVNRDGRWHMLIFEPNGDHWNAACEAPDMQQLAELTRWVSHQD